MRAYHVIAAVAVIAVILVGIGVKLPFFAAPIAEADSRFSNGIGADVLQMHQNSKNAPVQEVHDMTFVYFVGDNSAGD
jgi:hypothetical protein